MRYRRSTTPGATYFFTVVTYRQRAMLCEPDTVALLREAFATVKQRHPFRIDAVVILPDHLHCLWTLPPDDADYSTRWMLIKSHFTRRCAASLKTARSPALRHKREQTIWQHRYWEHQIRDERDFERHCDYLHYNPVNHGLVTRVADWPYSSFHRLANAGLYLADWGAGDLEDFPTGEA
ncbi:MAG: transposase [Candidatus Competibacter sp.]|nr:transposase [Candidatus Competibacter sp.]